MSKRQKASLVGGSIVAFLGALIAVAAKRMVMRRFSSYEHTGPWVGTQEGVQTGVWIAIGLFLLAFGLGVALLGIKAWIDAERGQQGSP